MKALILNAGGYDVAPHVFENVTFPFEVEVHNLAGGLVIVLGSELIKAGAAKADIAKDGFKPEEDYPFWRDEEVKLLDC